MNELASPAHIPADVVREANDIEAIIVGAHSMRVDCQDDYETAATLVRKLAGYTKQLESRRKEITGPMDAAKKSVMDFFRPRMEKIEQADKVLAARMIEYRRVVEKKRREAEALAAEAARKEREKLERQAAKAEEKGRVEQAAALAAAAQSMPAAPVVHLEAPAAEGVHTQVRWKYRIVDAAAIPREYLVPDEKKIAGVVRAMKEATSIPGVEAYPDESLVRR